MNILTAEPQFIFKDGKPEYAIIPYRDFSIAFENPSAIPQEVVDLAVRNGMNMLKSWRQHLNIRQSDLANRIGITQAAYSKAEKGRPGKDFLMRAAEAMGISLMQLDLDSEAWFMQNTSWWP